MNFLFVAPRYHTNSIKWVETLKSKKHNVYYAVINQSKIEDYSSIKPTLFNKSKLSNIIIKIIGNSGSNNFRSFPSLKLVNQYINKINPDVVIIRDITRWFSLIFFISLIFFNTKTKKTIIFYNQNPITERITLIRKIIIKIIKNLFNVKFVSSILEGFDYQQNQISYKKNHIFFMNFVTENNFYYKQKYKKNSYNSYKILTVGKYEERKNFFFLVDAISDIIKKDSKIKISVSIVGENSKLSHNNYKKRLIKYTRKKKLSEIFFFYENIKYKDMPKFYSSSDLFILPAYEEPASYSILEALSHGCPVICSSQCGTKSYIKHNVNGYIFKNNSKSDLIKYIHEITNRDKYLNLKKNTFNLSNRYMSSDIFYKKIKYIINEQN